MCFVVTPVIADDYFKSPPRTRQEDCSNAESGEARVAVTSDDDRNVGWFLDWRAGQSRVQILNCFLSDRLLNRSRNEPCAQLGGPSRKVFIWQLGEFLVNASGKATCADSMSQIMSQWFHADIGDILISPQIPSGVEKRTRTEPFPPTVCAVVLKRLAAKSGDVRMIFEIPSRIEKWMRISPFTPPDDPIVLQSGSPGFRNTGSLIQIVAFVENCL